MASGPVISGAGHGLLLLSFFIGGFFQSTPEEPFESADVSVITSEEFAALTAPELAPSATTEIPIPETPQPDPVPDTPVVEEPVETPEPPEPEIPETPDPTPEVVETPTPEPEVIDKTPLLTQPDTSDVTVPTPAPPSETPAPLDAPRVAPTPVPESPPTPEIADAPTPTVSEEAETPEVSEETTPAAPEEATTEIVTEAETPGSALAVSSSIRPVGRPRTETISAEPEPDPTPEAETPETTTDTSAINDAVADALSDALGTALEETPAVPLGPPLSGAEKDGLRISVQQCWNTGALSTDALNTTVVVGVTMGRDGKPDTGSIRMISASGGSDAAAQQAFGAARRAIIRCGINGYDLPVEKYEQWKDIEMTFNPERMRIK